MFKEGVKKIHTVVSLSNLKACATCLYRLQQSSSNLCKHWTSLHKLLARVGPRGRFSWASDSELADNQNKNWHHRGQTPDELFSKKFLYWRLLAYKFRWSSTNYNLDFSLIYCRWVLLFLPSIAAIAEWALLFQKVAKLYSLVTYIIERWGSRCIITYITIHSNLLSEKR